MDNLKLIERLSEIENLLAEHLTDLIEEPDGVFDYFPAADGARSIAQELIEELTNTVNPTATSPSTPAGASLLIRLYPEQNNWDNEQLIDVDTPQCRIIDDGKGLVWFDARDYNLETGGYRRTDADDVPYISDLLSVNPVREFKTIEAFDPSDLEAI